MTYLDDHDLVARLQALSDGIPLPDTSVDEDARRGRQRLRRTHALVAGAAAAVVALVIGTAVVVTGTLRADGPIPPVETPTPTPPVTKTVLVHALHGGPDTVDGLYPSSGDGFFMVDADRWLWRRNPTEWVRLFRVQTLPSDGGDMFVHVSADGQDAIATRLVFEKGAESRGTMQVTHDGGQTWSSFDYNQTWDRLKARVPDADCWNMALLTTGLWLGAGCGNDPAAFWQPEGSSQWQPRPLPPLWSGTYPGPVALGDVLWMRVSSTEFWEAGAASWDTGLTWQDLANPCDLRSGPRSPWSYTGFGSVGDLLYQVCPDNGTPTIYLVGDGGSWAPSVTLPADADSVEPLGEDRWLAHTPAGQWLLVTAGGATPVVGLPEGDWLPGGWATAGGDTYVAARTSTGQERLFVSHDGGLSWQEGGP